MIEVIGLYKRFGELKVLNDLSFTCEPGHITGILGRGGEGKSTLIKMLVGAIDPDEGEIRIFDREIRTDDEETLNDIRREIGVLFQHTALFQNMSVRENIALPMVENTELDPKIIDIMVKMKLDQVGLPDFEDYLPRQLNPGMQKHVALARAIALEPKIVLYDEPTSGLDPISSRAITKLITDLNQVLKMTSVVFTNDPGSVMEIAHKLILLHHGEICFEGTPDEMKQTEDPLVRQYINGDPDGPIQLRQSREEYEQSLLGSNL